MCRWKPKERVRERESAAAGDISFLSLSPILLPQALVTYPSPVAAGCRPLVLSQQLLLHRDDDHDLMIVRAARMQQASHSLQSSRCTADLKMLSLSDSDFRDEGSLAVTCCRVSPSTSLFLSLSE